MTEEKWKDIIGYNGMYCVSDQGRVKSLPRKQRVTERVFNPVKKKTGYLHVTLCKDGEHKTHLVHRLVALAFIPNSDGKEVNHKDSDRTNNSVTNLEWVTKKQNVAHSIKHGFRNVIGQHNANSSLKDWDILNIEMMRSTGATYKQIAGRYRVSICCISDIFNGRSWKHVI